MHISHILWVFTKKGTVQIYLPNLPRISALAMRTRSFREEARVVRGYPAQHKNRLQKERVERYS